MLAWVFHLLLGLSALVMLYAESFPGFALLVVAPALLLWAALGVAWLVWFVRSLVRRRLSRLLLVAPLTVLGVVALAATHLPLQLRFGLSRSAFDHQLRTLSEARPSYDSPVRVGTYSITRWERVRGRGVVFYEDTGDSIFDYAGFAYLPSGPSPSLANGSFEGPQWRSLGGHWYSFTASW